MGRRMSTWAVIPVKQLAESKRRLQHLLSSDERAALMWSFLGHLLIVLREARGIDRVLVVSADPEVVTLAREHGAKVLVEAASLGLNAAAEMGRLMAVAGGASAVLVLPADLPFVRAEDIERILEPLGIYGRPMVALCSDELEDGTNALLLAPPQDFTFRYGPGSFRAHQHEARRRGIEPVLVSTPGLRFDLDTESDWLAYNGFLLQPADK